MPEEAKPKPEAEPPAKDGFAWDQLGPFGKVLAAVGTGLGVLGFVSFFGAAILWVRMDEAGLPGNDTLAIVPKSVLVATGASFLVPALAIALIATVVLFLIDAIALRRGERPLRETKGVLREKRREAMQLQREAEASEGVVAMADQARQSAAAAQQLGATSPGDERETDQRAKRAAERGAAARAKAVAAEKELADLELELKKRAPQQQEAIEGTRKKILVAGTIVFFAGGTLWALWHYSVQGGRNLLVLAIAALVLITFCVVVRDRTGSFGWFAAAAIVAVGTMSGLITYYRTMEDPKVEPAAVLRSKGPPLYGFYVAQTSDRVYLGTEIKEGQSVLHEVPRDEVLGLVVGDLQDPATAEERALIFARRLCLRSRERRANGKVLGKKGGGKRGEEIAAGCTSQDKERLFAQ